MVTNAVLKLANIIKIKISSINLYIMKKPLLTFPGWKITVFTFFFLPVFLTLSVCQYDRSNDKQLLLDSYQVKKLKPAISYENVDWKLTLDFQNVILTGPLTSLSGFLLDNSTNAGKPGYKQIVPVLMDDGFVLLIDLGWIEKDFNIQDRQRVLPKINTQINATGFLRPVPERVTLKDIKIENQDVLQSLDLALLENKYKKPIRPWLLNLDPFHPQATIDTWQPTVVSPQRHFGYSVQWFLMAIALLGMYLYLSYRSSGDHYERSKTQR